MVDDFFGFFEVADPTLKLIDLGIGIILLEAFGELLQLMYLCEEIGDICVELLDHTTYRFFQLSSFFLNPLLLDTHLSGQRIQQFGSLMQRLVIFLREGVINAIQKLEP